MAYGTPASPDDIEAYYTHVRRGRPAPPELLAELTRRYQAIGGVSPLMERTRAQARQLQEALDDHTPNRYVVEIGLKHARPFIEDAVEQLTTTGIDRLLGLVLAPHYSTASVGEYLSRMQTRSSALATNLPVAAIESWNVEPAYIAFLVNQVTTMLKEMPPNTKVLFSAHSLPQRVVQAGDPYVDQLLATAEEVARVVGLEDSRWALSWQSAGRTPEPWLGPDILEQIRAIAADGRTTGVLVCPCGFVSDHLEVLYDLDIEAATLAGGLGLSFSRTALPNNDSSLFAALAHRLVELDR